MAAYISDKVTFQRLWVQIEEVETPEDYYSMWNEICTQEDEYNAITVRERATLHACLDAVASLRQIIGQED